MVAIAVNCILVFIFVLFDVMLANISGLEMQALQDLYSASNGPDWSCCQTSGSVAWNFTNSSADPCIDNWQGISCDSDVNGYYISKLDLHDLNLQGTLINSLNNLTGLYYFNVDSNGLKSTIPSSYGNFSGLKYLYLKMNDLTGTLPSALGNLSELKSLNVYKTLLTGPIPSAFGGITSLQYLHVDECSVSGVIPNSFGKLVNLKSLYLFGNCLTGNIPNSLGDMASLALFEIDYNSLTGSIPSSIGQLTLLSKLRMNSNCLSGSIPSSLLQLSHLTLLDLSTNGLNGSIPVFGELSKLQKLYFAINDLTGTMSTSIVNLSQLVSLELFTNCLVGSVPSVLGSLTRLTALFLSDNFMTGQIPNSLGNLTQLVFVDLSTNCLTGSIPSSLEKLKMLNYVYLNNNGLTGPIPNYFGNFSKLLDMELRNNRLTGTIPGSLGYLTQLEDLDISTNSLTGSVPTSMGNLVNAQYFMISENILNGTILATLGNLSVVQYLYLSGNSFTGTIPSSLGSLSHMLFLFLYQNSLSGTIPAELANLTDVLGLDFYGNYLTGTVPSEFAFLRKLQYLFLYSNSLTSSIPSALGGMSQMECMYLMDNSFTGTIPSLLGDLHKLEFLALNDNSLEGSIPSSFSKLSSLVQLVMQFNMLSGTLYEVFDANVQLQLSAFQINDNQISGTLPEMLFNITSLTTVVATSNCFHGSISPLVCNAQNLISLVLDGLSSAPGCRYVLFPGLSSSYVLKTPVNGNIPSCILDLPYIASLHLSGNGFTGSIPNQISDSLVDLDISHNALVGQIDEVIQTRDWYQLDLSFNRLTGTLLSTFKILNSSSYLSLENNRLSGIIPPSMHNMLNISILTSNMFSCDLEGNDLPIHNNDRHNYECGSTNFNIQYFIWMGLLMIFLTVGCVVVRWRNAVEKFVSIGACVWYASMWLAVTESNGTKSSFVELGKMFNAIIHIVAYCAVFIVVVLFPMYCILSMYYGTYTHAYAYTGCAAFLQGVVPFVLLLLCWIFFIFELLVFILKVEDDKVMSDVDANRDGRVAGESPACRTEPADKQRAESTAEADSTSAEHVVAEAIGDTATYTSVEPPIAMHQWVSIYVIFIFINVVVVVGANICYVYVAIYGTRVLLVVALVLVSIFKLIWNNSCGPSILGFVCSLVLPSVRQDVDMKIIAQMFNLQILVTLLNNILIPLAVVMCVSPNCFYNFFVAQLVVVSNYTAEYCTISVTEVVDGVAMSETICRPVLQSLSYNPPFVYNFQCSSSFITYYSPAFIIICITSTMVVPILKFLLVQLYHRSDVGTTWFDILDAILPAILKKVPDDDSIDPATSTSTVYFESNRIIIALSNCLGLLLTYGVVFPPLAISLTLTIIALVYCSKLELGRFITSAISDNKLKCCTIVEKECVGVSFMTVIRSNIWMFLMVCCLFYTLFLFDTLGNSVGVVSALWVCSTVPLLPFMMYLAVRFCGIKASEAPFNRNHNPNHNQFLIGTETFNPVASDKVHVIRGSGSIEMSNHATIDKI